MVHMARGLVPGVRGGGGGRRVRREGRCSVLSEITTVGVESVFKTPQMLGQRVELKGETEQCIQCLQD